MYFMKVNLVFKGKQLISSQMQFWDPNLLVGINYLCYGTPFYMPTYLPVLKMPDIMCLMPKCVQSGCRWV